SGVNYHRLLDIGREVVEDKVRRPLGQRLLRVALLAVMPRPALFAPLLWIGQLVRPLLPGPLRDKIPQRRAGDDQRPASRHPRRVVMLEGCVQPGIAPATNAAAARVLDALGISVISTPGAGCCGALRFHLNAQDGALADMKRNIDAWQPALAAGAEAVVSTASGCGAHLAAYGELLARDGEYADRARVVSDLNRDIAQVLAAEETALTALLEKTTAGRPRRRVAFHAPCTLERKSVGQ